jgi:ribosomal protein L37AE/L43A
MFERPPFNLCAQCGAELLAPVWAEHRSERHVRNLWSCERCGYEFETFVYFPASEPRDQTQASAASALTSPT